MNQKTLSLITLSLLSLNVMAAEPATLKLIGDWELEVTYNGKTSKLTVVPPAPTIVKDELYKSLRDYRPTGGGWTRGTALRGVKAQECTSRHALVKTSLVVKSSTDANAIVYEDQKDYALTADWGTVGRLPKGRIKKGQPVYMSYEYIKLRIDAIVLTKEGTLAVRQGVAHPANPEPAPILPTDTRLANIWFNGHLQKLSDDNLFPILENAYPEPPKTTPSIAQKLIPRAYAKLVNGEKIRILAWGDSVTVGTFVPNPHINRWQNQFVTRLKAQFPKAQIELITEAWGGRNTSSYLNEPKGSIHNYQEKVLDVKPDLIITEFVNDAGLNEKGVFERYGRILNDFKNIGAEWIILTPHYVRPDWMGLKSEKNIDNDPRIYVQALRKFAAQNNIALADGSLRYGRLWRQGIPYASLMMNAINHPNPFGMKLFADALMALF